MSCLPEYFPSQVLEDSPVEMGIAMSRGLMLLLGMFSVKDNKDKIKKLFYKVVFKRDVKIVHVML